MPHAAQTYKDTISATWDNPQETHDKVSQENADQKARYEQAEDAVERQFEYLTGSAPFITLLEPGSFTCAAGATCDLTVHGKGFVASSKIWVAGDERETDVVSGTELTSSFAAPASTSTVDVQVKNADGWTSNTFRLAFTITGTRRAASK